MIEADAVAADVVRRLRDRGTPERSVHEKAYLKSDLEFVGASVPAIRAAAQEVTREAGPFDHDGLVALAEALWAMSIHEARMAAVELLDIGNDVLGAGDAPVIERFLREAKTWAIVDGLSASVMGKIVERDELAGTVLDRWSADPDFWLRRASMLSLLVALRRGGGDWSRFARYADAMLEETEFFIRKAIGWVLRDTARKRPALVAEWLLPRAGRASGVTLREAVKPLSDDDRAAILAAASRGGGGS